MFKDFNGKKKKSKVTPDEKIYDKKKKITNIYLMQFLK